MRYSENSLKGQYLPVTRAQWPEQWCYSGTYVRRDYCTAPLVSTIHWCCISTSLPQHLVSYRCSRVDYERKMVTCFGAFTLVYAAAVTQNVTAVQQELDDGHRNYIYMHEYTY